MGAFGSMPFEDIIARGRFGELDLTKLIAVLDGTAPLSSEGADWLFGLHAQGDFVETPVRPQFFIRTIADYIVDAVEPVGYVTVEKAAWLIQRIHREGQIQTRIELNLLIGLEHARWAPRSLVVLGLDQVRQAVAVGNGPLRPDQSRAAGLLFDEEIEIVRRLIYAFGGDRRAAVTREEAEILFEINHSLDGGEVNTAWTELFVKAIANIMLATSGYRVPSREEAMRSEAWFDASADMVAMDVVKAIVTSGLHGVLGAYRSQTRVERTLAQLECEYRSIITGEEPPNDNVEWLTERFGGSEALSLNEIALVNYFADAGVTMEPVLQAVLERVRLAA